MDVIYIVRYYCVKCMMWLLSDHLMKQAGQWVKRCV